MSVIERSPALELHVHVWCGGACACGAVQCQFVKYLTPSQREDRRDNRPVPRRCRREAAWIVLVQGSHGVVPQDACEGHSIGIAVAEKKRKREAAPAAGAMA